MTRSNQMRRTGCRAPGCASTTSEFYCGADLRELEAGIERTVRRIVRDARQVYVGRSYFPEQRLLYHRRNETGNDHLAIVHWADDREEVAWLEEKLIEDLDHRDKLQNDIYDSEGPWVGDTHCIYLAWTWKASARPWTGVRFTDVTSLDGRRVAPARTSLVLEPIYLRSTIAPERASRIIAERQASVSGRVR